MESLLIKEMYADLGMGRLRWAIACDRLWRKDSRQMMLRFLQKRRFSDITYKILARVCQFLLLILLTDREVTNGVIILSAAGTFQVTPC